MMHLRALLVACIALAFVSGASASDSCGDHTICFTYPPKTVVSSGIETFRGVGDRKSCPVKPWNPDQIAKRVQTIEVTFDKVFAEPPDVQLSVVSLDEDAKYNLRYNTRANDITTTGCVIQFDVWCNTYVYMAAVSYQAIGFEADKKPPPPPAA